MVAPIDEYIDKEIRPYLQLHHGDISLVELKEGVLKVRLLGKCSGCPSAQITLEEVIEERIKDKFPHITRVVLEDSIGDDLYELARGILRKGEGNEA